MNNMNNMGNMNNMNRTSAGYCVKCGTELFAGYKVCPVCATPIGAGDFTQNSLGEQEVPVSPGVRGNDIRKLVRITFMDAVFGTETAIDLPLKDECPVCNGTGNIQGITCRNCAGRRFIESVKKIHIKVPAGIDNGQSIRLREMGDPGLNGGERGDLLVTILVCRHPFFERKGYDIYTKEEVVIHKIQNEESLTVTTIHGPYTLNLNKNITEGQTIKIPGEGIPTLKDKTVRGDHIVRVVCLADINK